MSAVQHHRSRILPSLALALALVLAPSACGGSGDQTASKDPSSADAAGRSDASKRALDAAKMRGDLPGASVYDAQGQAHACEPPKPSEQCPPAEINLELKDQCSLAGYQVRRCGCGTFCAGNFAQGGPKAFYDASGAKKECAKEVETCDAPPPSASFQDACNDKGHRLKVCGCEWLCSGNPAP